MSPVAFVLYQASIYLSVVLHKSQIEIGQVLWIPPFGWEIGFFFWGWVTDRYSQGGASTARLRSQILLLMLLSAPLAFVPLTQSYPLTLCLCIERARNGPSACCRPHGEEQRRRDKLQRHSRLPPTRRTMHP